MSLTPGARLGPYEVVSALGAGGMGEVYRARDTRLKREVALKILPESFASDPDRLARFQREAEVLATLNHPHIAAIYGIEDGPAEAGHYVQALVLELVEGETLADRIARGAIPVEEALPIARQIAEALEAAHEQGIIHRDLKPANIKITPAGVVKVLDFGLAKLNDSVGRVPRSGPAGSAEQDPAYVLSQSPTITSPAMMTGVGMILGTAAYMAPEQAKGKPADKRSDVWAFGCVLYEMLTGRRAFDGEDMVDVLGAVARLEPAWETLPADVPQAIRTLLRGCLVKDRRHRVADISTAIFVLDSAAMLAAPGTPASIAAVPRWPMWRRMAVLTAGALVVAVTSAAAVWLLTRGAPLRVSRTTIQTSGAAALNINGNGRNLAVTPDGSRVVYRGNGQILVRALDQLAPLSLTGVGNPQGLFVSPDGQWVGFFDGNNLLKKVAITGGPPVLLATVNGSSRGASWSEDGTIVFATTAVDAGLQRVSAAGGEPTVLAKPNTAAKEGGYRWPEFLPGGRAVLFTIAPATGGLDGAQIAVLDLQTGTRTVLVRGGSHAHYVSSGHLVYASAGTLRAVPFDVGRLQIRGTAVPVIPEVLMGAAGSMNAVVARDGTLMYLSPVGTVVAIGEEGRLRGVARTLVWVDRQGRETAISAPPHTYDQPRLSPDGTRVAVHTDDEQTDLWLWDFGRTTFTRVTFDPNPDLYPVWMPDGRRLLFSSSRVGARNLYWQAADGTGGVERLTDGPNSQNATAVTPDGRNLIFTQAVEKTREDVMEIDLTGTHRVTPLVQSPFIERNGIVSPDGRWLAYEADDSGRLEIYVRPYPDVNSGRWQVSTMGGARPLWSHTGQELIYVSPAGALMRVGVERASSWAATTPTMVVKEGYFTNPGGLSARMYDVAPDGERFLMIKNPPATEQSVPTANLIVVQNWLEDLKRLVPVK